MIPYIYGILRLITASFLGLFISAICLFCFACLGSHWWKLCLELALAILPNDAFISIDVGFATLMPNDEWRGAFIVDLPCLLIGFALASIAAMLFRTSIFILALLLSWSWPLAVVLQIADAPCNRPYTFVAVVLFSFLLIGCHRQRRLSSHGVMEAIKRVRPL